MNGKFTRRDDYDGNDASEQHRSSRDGQIGSRTASRSIRATTVAGQAYGRSCGADGVSSAAHPVGRSQALVAALYVETNGVYYGLPDVDPWDEERDARLYNGPLPVVAHPPCARWSRLAGFTEARFGYKRGEDGGCFEAALRCVRQFGGVLEHPAFSSAWDRYDLPEPVLRHGWTHSLWDGGASCYVEQGRYGLPVKKATWLYAFGCQLPELAWGFTADADGMEPNTEWGGMDNWRRRVTFDAANSTPPAFRDVLLEMARSAHAYREAVA